MSSQFISDYPLPYLVFSVVTWYFFLSFLRINLTFKPAYKWHIFAILVLGLSTTTCLSFLNHDIKVYLLSIITLLQYTIISLFFEGSNQKRCFSVIFAWALTCIFEALSIHFCVMLFNTDIQSLSMNSAQLSVANALSKLVPLVLVVMYPYFFQSGKYQRDFLTFTQALGFFTIPTMSLAVVCYIHNVQLSQNSKNDTVVIAICISLLVINVIFFWLFEAFSSSMKQHYEHKMLEMQVNYYEELYSKVGEERTALSTLRHNMKNDLLSLKSSLKSKDIEKLETELNSLLEDTSLENHRTSVIPIVDAVLSYKIQQAEKLGVTILHEQAINSDLEISNPHLANILGNALDNAVEHCSQLADKQKRSVHLVLKKLDKNLLLTVSNYYEGNIEFQNELPLSSKRDGKSHGIGLATIRSVVKELGGHFSIEADNQVFTVKVVIYQCFP